MKVKERVGKHNTTAEKLLFKGDDDDTRLVAVHFLPPALARAVFAVFARAVSRLVFACALSCTMRSLEIPCKCRAHKKK